MLVGETGRDLGKWNSTYRHVYALDLTGLKEPGTYRARSGSSVSPEFTVARSVTAGSAAKALTFFNGQRDGFNGQRDGSEAARKPRHLNDRAAYVYGLPVFTGKDTDEIKGGLTRI